jgi:hypothetical protein
MSVKVCQITYSPADIYANGVTPQLIMSAPTAGYARTILSISHDMVYNSLAYAGGTVLTYGTGTPGYPYQFYDDQVLTATSNFNGPVDKSDSSTAPFTTTRGLYVSNTGIAITGNSSIVATIVYQDILITDAP